MKSLTPQQRAIIKYAYEQGESVRAIAKNLGCGKTTVSDTILRLKNTGTTSPQKSLGRQKIFDDQARASLKRLVKKGKNRRLTLHEIRELWHKKTGTAASISTFRRVLHESGLHSRTTRRKPLLTEANMAKRLAWALQHRHWTVNQWRRVLFSDETTLYQFRHNRLSRTWRESQPKSLLFPASPPL